MVAVNSGQLVVPEGVEVPVRESVEAVWDRELERRAWPAVQALAARLLEVRTMTGEEVSTLVEPLLP